MKAFIVSTFAAALILGAPTAFAADQKPDTAAQKKAAQETNQSMHPRTKASKKATQKVSKPVRARANMMRNRNPVSPIAPAGRIQARNPAIWNNPNVRVANPRWSRGDRLPAQYRQSQYYVNDWQQRGFRRPPRGYRWVHDNNNNFFLALIATGMIAEVVNQNDRSRQWDQRYSRTYTYNDDVYYRNCRNSPDPAGVIVGGLIGGLLGNAAGHGGTGATLAGVIFGGAVGAALTSNMDCEDRSYAYRTYYNGFNSGRVGRSYAWRNPQNDHHGDFRIRSYYNDPYGFRCANFTQVTYIQGRSYNATGRACRQPDGTWAVVN